VEQTGFVHIEQPDSFGDD